MVRTRLFSLALLALGLLAALPAQAQFGKNKVQYKDFRWHTIQTENFDIYYYEGEEESAVHAARMAERAYSRLSKILSHDIEDRVPVIVYASHTDFQQTNISPGLIPEGVGGITEFSKRRVFLPFTGSYGEFDHVLTHELVHAFQVDLMFGGGADANPFSFQPPLWFMEGMAEYLSIGHVDPNTEMWLRWSALEGHLVPLPLMSRVFDIRVYRIGQAIFDFVGERYGDEKIGELLKRTVNLRSVNLAFEKTIGMDLNSLNDEWEDYVKRKYFPQIVELDRPEAHGRKLFKDSGFNGTHLAPAISPDGDRVVFIKDSRFSKDIMLASAIDGKILDKLLEGERSGDFESLRYFYTSIGWSPDGTRIAFPSKRGGEDVLNIFDVAHKKVLRTFSFAFDALYSPAYHPNGNQIVFTAVRGGKSDLFVVDLRTDELTQLTDDPYLVRDPQWSPDGRRVAYVTDRGEDTDLEALTFGKPKIAILDMASGELTIPPFQQGKNISPFWGPEGDHLAFVSDRDGISNLYVQNLNTQRLYRLTNVVTGVTGIIESSPPFSWSRDGRRIVFTTFMGDGWELYSIDDPLDRMEEVDVPEPLERIARRERERLFHGDLSSAGASDPLLLASSTQDHGHEAHGRGHFQGHDHDEASRYDALSSSGEVADAESEAAEGSEGESDAIEDQVEEVLDLLAPDAPGLTVAGPGAASHDPLSVPAPGEKPEIEKLPRPTVAEIFAETTHDLPDPDQLESKPYKLRWSPDFVGASPIFASNVGFAGQAQLAISDILSNHVFQIGASVYGSLAESDLFLGYFNLQGRTNWGASLFQFRNDFGIFAAPNRVEFESQIYRGAQFLVSHPFSKFSRFEFAARGVAVSRSVFDQSFNSGFLTTRELDSDLVYYAGPEIALVTDNVVFGYYGPMQGGRARISSEQAFGDIQFNTTITDIRRYFSMGRTAVFATRLIAGFSVGRNPQIFRIGGPETLRGLDYGEVEGNYLGLANFEVRFPLVETLRLGWPLRVGLGGIGGVLFFDIGGAFGENARVFNNGALDDLTAGYGFGFRLGLGYFALKYDIARRTDFKRSSGSENYFSIGIDY